MQYAGRKPIAERGAGGSSFNACGPGKDLPHEHPSMAKTMHSALSDLNRFVLFTACAQRKDLT
jgi:hypothetical protein